MLYGLRSFESIGLVLHGPSEFVRSLPSQLGFVEFGEMRETDWKPVTRPTQELRLPFGRRGLKHATAALLIPILYEHWYALTHLQLERRLCAAQGKEPVWKESATLLLERRTHRVALSSRALQLTRLLEKTLWRRARVLVQMEGLKANVAFIELVMPRVHHRIAMVNELSFDKFSAFTSRKLPAHHVLMP